MYWSLSSNMASVAASKHMITHASTTLIYALLYGFTTHTTDRQTRIRRAWQNYRRDCSRGRLIPSQNECSAVTRTTDLVVKAINRLTATKGSRLHISHTPYQTYCLFSFSPHVKALDTWSAFCKEREVWWYKGRHTRAKVNKAYCHQHTQ